MSDFKFALIDLSGVKEEPLSKLIGAVSQGIGAIYEPIGIRRKAIAEAKASRIQVKAEAEAALILAESDAKREALLKRAAHRLAIQEIKRQENIENIINQAAKSLPETVSKEPVDPDWVSRFFDECKDVSNEDLQKIWGRLLSGEVTTPGSCSRRTLAVLKNLSPNDANIFNILCNLVWHGDNNYFLPYERSSRFPEQLKKYNIFFDEVMHLGSIGLIHSNFNISFQFRHGDILEYLDFKHECNAIPSNFELNIAGIPLTKPGTELFFVTNAIPNMQYYVDTINMLIIHHNVFLSCSLT